MLFIYKIITQLLGISAELPLSLQVKFKELVNGICVYQLVLISESSVNVEL